MRIVTILLVLILVWAVVGVGDVLYEHDLENNKTTDIYNVTSSLYWNSSNFQTIEHNLSSKGINISKINSLRIRNVLNKAIDFFGFTGFEFAKWGVEFGYSNGDKIDSDVIVQYMQPVTIMIIVLIILSIAIPILPMLIALAYVIITEIYGFFKKLHKKRKARQPLSDEEG